MKLLQKISVGFGLAAQLPIMYSAFMKYFGWGAHMFRTCEQNAGQNHNVDIGSKSFGSMAKLKCSIWE